MEAVRRHALPLLAIATMLTVACVPKPFGYERIRNSDQYISRSELRTVVGERRSRSDVVARFGPPDAESIETQSIGYQRCVTSVGYRLEAPPTRPTIESCQRVGFWFDVDQCAFAWKEARHNSDDGPYGSTLQEWIKVPERHTGKEVPP